jgi:hypothetical protein
VTEFTVFISPIFTADGVVKLLVWTIEDDEFQILAIRPMPEEIEA